MTIRMTPYGHWGTTGAEILEMSQGNNPATAAGRARKASIARIITVDVSNEDGQRRGTARVRIANWSANPASAAAKGVRVTWACTDGVKILWAGRRLSGLS